VKTTSCDWVALTTNLYPCMIELKEECPARRDPEQLVLAIAAAATTISISDEQILALP
jgi:hypothetical protein